MLYNFKHLYEKMWQLRWYSSCGFMVLIVEYKPRISRTDKRGKNNIKDLIWGSTERRPVRDAFPLVQMPPWLQGWTHPNIHVLRRERGFHFTHICFRTVIPLRWKTTTFWNSKGDEILTFVFGLHWFYRGLEKFNHMNDHWDWWTM